MALTIDGHDYVDVHHGNVFQWLILGNFILPSSTTLLTKQKFLEHQGFDGQFRSAEETEFFITFIKRNGFYVSGFSAHGISQVGVGPHEQQIILIRKRFAGAYENCVDDHLIYRNFAK